MQGRRIYVDGILPDGSPLKAIRFGGASEVTGAEAACVNCHRRSGYGSIEGRILVPPIAGAVLFAPGVFASERVKGSAHATFTGIERFRARSAYDEQKLMRTLRHGRDPDGTLLRPPMARYKLNAHAVKALSAYLRQLSTQTVDGIEGETLHLGTVFTPDIPLPQREAILEVLHAYAATRNSGDTRWQLHIWQLTGMPQEWDAQLDEHYLQQPVFALLSGAGSAEWLPVQRFCERHSVACLLPSIELAPKIEGDYYSLYYSSGLALEARLLAHHLTEQPVAPRRLLQVVADDAGKRAANELRAELDRSGSLMTVLQLAPEEYAAIAPPSAQDTVVWWLRPEQIARLTATVPIPSGPLYLSALLAPAEELVMSDVWKQAVRYVSIFDSLSARRAQTTLLPWLARQGISATNLRLRGDAYAACNFFNNAISAVQLQTAHGLRGPLTRERMLEALESSMTVYRDDAAPYYWQMSLGPSQRYLVKGGMLLSHIDSDATEWVPATARIVP